ncbi:MAG: SDR family oxidoreductase [Alphaproteobacteria bacterium]|nr:SDR family oxidoreductase [Alphaproteobacteria bacterium]
MSKQTVIITGGSKGIGLDIVKAFVAAGWSVIATARSITAEIESLGDAVRFVSMDVGNRTDHRLAVDAALAWTGQLNAYVNCAGFSKWSPLADISEDFLDNMLQTNVKGVFWGAQAAEKALAATNGAIINISSLAGKRGSANNSSYCASKFAVNGVTQSLAKELGPQGIRVNALCPVYVKTPGVLEALEENVSPTNGQDIETYLTDFTNSQTALRRLPTGKEIGEASVFLASNAASAITGQCINIDCGVMPQ